VDLSPFPWIGPSPISSSQQPGFWIPCRQSRQHQKLVEQRRKHACRRLPRIVTSNQSAPTGSDPWLRIHVLERKAHRARAQKRIRIKQNYIATTRLGKPTVVRAGKSEICVATDQTDVAKIVGHHISRPVV